jgi:hypothetical protein
VNFDSLKKLLRRPVDSARKFWIGLSLKSTSAAPVRSRTCDACCPPLPPWFQCSASRYQTLVLHKAKRNRSGGGPHSRSDVVGCLELLLDLGAVWDNTTPTLIGGAKSTIVNTSYRRSCSQLNIRPSSSCGEYWKRELAKCKTSERS